MGAAASIARYGWLFPQLFVAYFAQRRRRRLPFYMLGAFGRVVCLAGVAGVLVIAENFSAFTVVAVFFTLWTIYAFVSGIVAVPYNDIVARSIPSGSRSRLLAVRFFGGGILALLVAATAHRLLDTLPFPTSYAAVLFVGAALLLVSTLSFVSAGEPEAPPAPGGDGGFAGFLREGVEVLRSDRRFRLFVYSRWLAGAAAMALPFYILQVTAGQTSAADIALLLGAQTAGALLSNPLWGWWGDRRGKRSLLGRGRSPRPLGAAAYACLDRDWRDLAGDDSAIFHDGFRGAWRSREWWDDRPAWLPDGDLARRPPASLQRLLQRGRRTSRAITPCRCGCR